jgi:competence protein ComEA
MKHGIIITLTVLSIAAAQEQAADPKLPDGPGKKEMLRICTKCHELDGFTHSRNTRARWEGIVDEMISRGAEGTDEEFELVIEYLAKNFGRLNLNKGSAEELAQGLGLPKEMADAIVAYREKNGAYKKWEDLEKVPGLDMKKIESKKGYVEF